MIASKSIAESVTNYAFAVEVGESRLPVKQFLRVSRFESYRTHQTMVLSSNGKMLARLASHVGSSPTGTTKH